MDPLVREAALKPVAEAITRVANESGEPSQRAALLIALGWEESRYAMYVVNFDCKAGPVGARCDPDRKGEPQATSPFQVHRWCRKAWDDSLSAEQRLYESAKCASIRLGGYALKCAQHQNNDPIAGALAGYAANDCSWTGGARRAKTVRNVSQKMAMWKAK